MPGPPEAAEPAVPPVQQRMNGQRDKSRSPRETSRASTTAPASPTVIELRQICRTQGLKVSGRKAEHKDRISEHESGRAPTPCSVAVLHHWNETSPAALEALFKRLGSGSEDFLKGRLQQAVENKSTLVLGDAAFTHEVVVYALDTLQ